MGDWAWKHERGRDIGRWCRTGGNELRWGGWVAMVSSSKCAPWSVECGGISSPSVNFLPQASRACNDVVDSSPRAYNLPTTFNRRPPFYSSTPVSSPSSTQTQLHTHRHSQPRTQIPTQHKNSPQQDSHSTSSTPSTPPSPTPTACHRRMHQLLLLSLPRHFRLPRPHPPVHQAAPLSSRHHQRVVVMLLSLVASHPLLCLKWWRAGSGMRCSRMWWRGGVSAMMPF
jgi:hypothetical protein